jgi:hypothetical protein
VLLSLQVAGISLSCLAFSSLPLLPIHEQLPVSRVSRRLVAPGERVRLPSTLKCDTSTSFMARHWCNCDRVALRAFS